MEDGMIQREAMEESATPSIPQPEENASGGGGGLINHLISTVIPSEKDADNGSEGEPHEEEEEEGEGGGLLETLMTNLTSPRSSSPVDVEFFGAAEHEQETEDLQDHRGESTGGGIIEAIVSHLPDNAMPESDEASILIHSVIHD